ncbi:NAD(P)/FAD-dependent oxidoreductase, partial [Staphylococcus equorum]|uniref:NAD(P)/FAD-dependent oxidoreductase n=1 Tax=Staphylococcus equorum TaxID=246432 RepID=UPI000853E7BB
IVVGAGPAGASAARILMEEKKVLLLDEYYRIGGRLIGQLYEENNGEIWNGYEKAETLSDVLHHPNLTVKLSTSVTNIEKSREYYHVNTTSGNFKAKYLLVCAGAQELTPALPGSTLPGVMTVGAAQVLTNVQRVAPGNKGAIIGINVLSSAILSELHMANIEVKVMSLPYHNEVNAQDAIPQNVFKKLLNISHMAPSFFIKLGTKLLKTMPQIQPLAFKLIPKKGIKLFNTSVHLKKAVVSINGKEKVESITLKNVDKDGNIISNKEEIIPIDFVCLSGGLTPLSELLGLLDVSFTYIESLGGFIPLHNDVMETEIKNLYIAGNITGIEGAMVAMKQGEIAAYKILGLTEKVKSVQNELLQERREATIEFHECIEEGRDYVNNLWKSSRTN